MQDHEVVQRRQQIGNRIRAARRAADLTQEVLAERIGVDRRTVLHVESGEADARLTWLLRIAHAVEVGLADLVE